MSKQKMLVPGLVLALIAMTVLAVYLIIQVQQLKKTPEVVAQKEVEELVIKIGKLMELPADETPTVATVTDSEKLKEQPFFTKASNGDKVLIYTNSKKAILYSPDKNLIIDVAPVNIGQNQGAPAGTEPAPTPAPAEGEGAQDTQVIQ